MARVLPKVVHLVISLAPGGLERLVVDWTNARNQQCPGSTCVCCLDERGALAGQVENDAILCVQARRSRFPWDRAAVRRIVDLLCAPSAKPHAPVIIHAHNLAAWQYGVLAKVLWKTIDHKKKTLDHRPQTLDQEKEGEKDGCDASPARSNVYGLKSKVSSPPLRLVYTQHGANVHNMRWYDRVRARVLACFTDEIVAVSAATADVMAKTLWIPRCRIRVIANGVPCDRAQGSKEHGAQRAEIRRKMGIPEEAFVIGSVGRLAYVKGYDRLIAAFAAMRTNAEIEDGVHEAAKNAKPACNACGAATAGMEENGVSAEGGKEKSSSAIFATSVQYSSSRASVYLLLVGDGPERMALERQAQEMRVGARVLFAGYQPDPDAFLEEMNAFVLPSRSEGLPVSLLEAMRAGVPVAVTDVGESGAVIERGRCGVLLPETEEKWTEVLEGLLADSTGSSARAEAAKRRVLECYSMARTLEGYEKAYEGGRGEWGSEQYGK